MDDENEKKKEAWEVVRETLAPDNQPRDGEPIHELVAGILDEPGTRCLDLGRVEKTDPWVPNMLELVEAGDLRPHWHVFVDLPQPNRSNYRGWAKVRTVRRIDRKFLPGPTFDGEPSIPAVGCATVRVQFYLPNGENGEIVQADLDPHQEMQRAERSLLMAVDLNKPSEGTP